MSFITLSCDVKDMAAGDPNANPVQALATIANVFTQN